MYEYVFCYRLEDNAELRYANKALKTSLSISCRNPEGNQKEANHDVKILGQDSSAIKINRLDNETFNLVLSGYDNSDPQFNQLFTKWKRWARRHHISFADWIPPNSAKITRVQNEMRKMTNRVRDIFRAEMDGLLFRTAANQEKFLIDNACVVNKYMKVTRVITIWWFCSFVLIVFVHLHVLTDMSTF